MKCFYFSSMLLFSFSVSSMYCMDGDKRLLRTTSRPGGQIVIINAINKENETLEQFSERTKKLPSMFPGLFQDGRPRIQFDALGERKIELGFTQYHNGEQASNYIKIFDKDDKQIFFRVLDTNRYMAAALLSNRKDENVVALIYRLMAAQKSLNLLCLDFFTFVPGTDCWKNDTDTHIIGGYGTVDQNYDLDPECGDFDIQGSHFMVCGTRRRDAYKIGERERISKMFNLPA